MAVRIPITVHSLFTNLFGGKLDLKTVLITYCRRALKLDSALENSAHVSFNVFHSTFTDVFS